jgi:hypothetical protein
MSNSDRDTIGISRSFLLEIAEEIFEIDRDKCLIIGYAVIVKRPVWMVSLKEVIERASMEPPGIEEIKVKEREDISK